MKKTLVINYTPRHDSNTKKLTEFFINEIKDKTTLLYVDLAKETPDLLLEENLNLLIKRNFIGEALSSDEQNIMQKNDDFAQQVLDTDFIVLAFPMFNLSVPATVKAWIDAVLQVNKTFRLTENGYEGLCKNKQALVLMTAGSEHTINLAEPTEFATGLVKSCFNIIGISTTQISANGMNVNPNKIEETLKTAKQKIAATCLNWYQ